MTISEEIFKRLLKATDPTVTIHNIQQVAQLFANTNPALSQLVRHKCHTFFNNLGLHESEEKNTIPAIQLIIGTLESLDEENGTPAGSYYEQELLRVLKQADNELLAKWWNEYDLLGGWTFTDQGTIDPTILPVFIYKHGWLVRGEERITLSLAIEQMLVCCMNEIEYWIHRYTKTIYVNTTTEEWTMVFHIDPTDHKAVERMYNQLKIALMGEEIIPLADFL